MKLYRPGDKPQGLIVLTPEARHREDVWAERRILERLADLTTRHGPWEAAKRMDWRAR